MRDPFQSLAKRPYTNVKCMSGGGVVGRTFAALHGTCDKQKKIKVQWHNATEFGPFALHIV